jgi:hypothetical protein
MPVPKFQHFVPRFYLDNFSSPDGQIYVLDKTTLKIFRSTAAGIGGETYFYETPNAQKDSRPPIERDFGIVESATAPVIGRWLTQIESHSDFVCSDEDRWQVALFLSLQIFRTLEHRKYLAQFLEELQKRAGKTTSTYSEEELRDYGIRILYDLNLVDDFAVQIAERIWVFAANYSRLAFYTSDNPVLFKSHDNKSWCTLTELHLKGSQVIFPISPQLILYAKEPNYWNKVKQFDGRLSPVTFTDYMAEHENSGQVGCSTRFVYSRSGNFDFARMFCDLHPQIRDPDRQRLEWQSE